MPRYKLPTSAGCGGGECGVLDHAIAACTKRRGRPCQCSREVQWEITG